MKKRLLAVLLCFVTLLSLAGCGDGSLSNDKITIKKYKGLVVEVPQIEVTDEEIEMSIQSTLQTIATRKEITDRPAKEGDSVTIDFEGKLNGEPFQGGTAKGQTVDIGAGTFVPGFEDGIIGHKVGETFDVSLTFPEAYTAELAGKAVVFTMTLHKIEEIVVPELTDEILPKITDAAKTVKEYKEQVRKDLEKSNQESIESSIEGLVWEALMKQCEVKKYPQDQIDEYVAYVNKQLEADAKEQGITPAEYFEQYWGMSPEAYIKQSIMLRYAIELIAEKEDIVLTAQEYQDGLTQAAQEDGYTDIAAYEKEVGRETLELRILQPKVGKFLVEHCTRTTPKEADVEKTDKK